MKTSDLIVLLSTNVEPVNGGRVARTIGISVIAGIAVAIGAVFATLGVRSDISDPNALVYLPVKLLFTLQIVVLTSLCLIRVARPGGERTSPIALVMLPFIVIMMLAGLMLAAAPHGSWDRMLIGDRWLECLISIPTIAIVPFAAVVWTVRRMAPTDLTRAGALAGLVAGGISATAYALHCTDDSLPFVALWYGGTIVFCTLAGAKLGPRLLRW
ncbi:MAG: DUF1109 domain-containing protein [Pseudomonadota bacterium]